MTSPPYFQLRDYQVDGQIGMEPTPDIYVTKLVEVFREVRRVLRDDGTLWLNIGDSYAVTHHGKQGTTRSVVKSQAYIDNVTGIRREKTIPDGYKTKDLLMIPARVALALQADGWWLRSAIVWHKTTSMPESVKDRPSSVYEMVYLLAKSEQYHYDADAIREPYTSEYSRDAISKAGHAGGHRPKGNNFNKQLRYELGESTPATRADRARLLHPNGRNARNVWTITPQPFKGAHFATMAPELARRCILAGCPEGGAVLDPFGGAGTTGLVAGELNRRATLIELNPAYADIARSRLGHLVREDV